jgi:PAS domain S-box-containing protein
MFTVLYVDDEPGLLEVGKLFLEHSGALSVETALSAHDALEILKSRPVDCVVADYLMPEMDGIGFLKVLRREGNQVPFILFTGRGREEVVIEAINNGADFYLQKGGDPQAQFAELEHKIRQAVARHHAEQSRTEAELALRESEERMRLLIRQAPAALAMFDREMRYLAASRRWMADYHLGDRDIIGSSHYAIFPEITEELKAVHRRGLSGEVVSAAEEKFVRKDGSVQWLAWEVRPWYTTGDTVGGIIIFSEDITRQKEAEEALRQKTEELDQYFTASIDLFCIADTGGYFRRLNPEWERSLGYTLAEMEGHRFLDFIHPDDLPATLAAVADLSEQKQVHNFTNRFRHRDGTYRWLEWRSFPSGDRIFAAARDITERRQADAALRESEAQLSSILHSSPVLQFVIGRDHRILSWNRALEVYSGIPAAEMIGTDRQWRAFYPRQRPVLADLLVDNNEDGLFKWYAGKLQPSRYVEGAYEATDFFPAMGTSGTWLAFTAAPIRNADGAIIGAVETLEDITERVNATEALRAGEEEYRRILVNMQDAYIRSDENGIISTVNPSAVRMYGYGSAEEMIGMPSASLYAHPWQREDMLRKLQKPGGITDFAGVALRKDGTTFHVSLNVQFIRDEEGRVRGTEGIVRDISERKVMEHAITEANRKLNLLNSLTRHDIANQLTALRGFTRLAAAKERDPAIAGYLARIDTASVTISRQVEFMKTYHELGVSSPGWSLLSETVAKAAVPAVVFSGTCSDIEVFSDPMLEKVFFNLFENALRHGGHVTEIVVRCEPAPGGLVIIVEDNGTGIPADEKEKIFDKEFGKNTGLGLFLAKEILSITGITIRETGEPGRGARFEMTVPAGGWRNAGERPG